LLFTTDLIPDAVDDRRVARRLADYIALA